MTTPTKTRLTGQTAIIAAARDSTIVLCSYADPTAEGRTCIILDEVRVIAGDDPSRVYADVTPISWRDVPLHWLDGGRVLTDKERVKCLEEYRVTGGMPGVVMCNPADYGDSPEDADRMCYEGPQAEQIEWAGFEILSVE